MSLKGGASGEEQEPIHVLGWIVWARISSVQICVCLTIFPARVGGQGIPQQTGLLTVVQILPVLHDFLFSVQHLATEDTVEGCACCKDPKALAAVEGAEGPTVLPLCPAVVGQDVLLELGAGEELCITITAFEQVTTLIELLPVMGSMFHQLLLSFAAPVVELVILQSDLHLLLMHIQEVHLHVCKCGCDGLAAATFYLQLHRVLTIVLL